MPNYFVDETDTVGMFQQDYEPVQWLSVQDYSANYRPSSPNNPQYQNSKTGQLLPEVEVTIVLGDTMNEYSRTAYTFFILLGDVGGFNGAIIIFPAFVFSFYSESMYEKSLSNGTLVR